MIDAELVAEIAEFAIELYDENRNMPQATAVRKTIEKFADLSNQVEQPIPRETSSEKAESTPCEPAKSIKYYPVLGLATDPPATGGIAACMRLNAKLTTKLKIAHALLDRAAERLCDDRAPDATWWRELFVLTGQHMILTDEGWEPGENKQTYIEEWAKNPEWSDPILDEVNGDPQAAGSTGYPDYEATDPIWNEGYRKSAHEELAGRYESILGPELFDRRAEQDLQWGGPIHDDTHTPEEWWMFIAKCNGDAEANASDPEIWEDKLIDVAALAVAAIKSSRRKRNA